MSETTQKSHIAAAGSPTEAYLCLWFSNKFYVFNFNFQFDRFVWMYLRAPAKAVLHCCSDLVSSQQYLVKVIGKLFSNREFY